MNHHQTLTMTPLTPFIPRRLGPDASNFGGIRIQTPRELDSKEGDENSENQEEQPAEKIPVRNDKGLAPSRFGPG